MRSPLVAFSLTLALAVSSSTFANEGSGDGLVDQKLAVSREDEPMDPQLAERLDDELVHEQFVARLEAELREHAQELVSEQLVHLIGEIEERNALALAEPRGEAVYVGASSISQGPRYVITIRDVHPGCRVERGEVICAGAPHRTRSSFASSPAPR